MCRTSTTMLLTQQQIRTNLSDNIYMNKKIATSNWLLTRARSYFFKPILTEFLKRILETPINQSISPQFGERSHCLAPEPRHFFRHAIAWE